MADPQQEYTEATALARRRRELREERQRLASLPPDPRVLEVIERGKRSLLNWAAARLRNDIISSLDAETGRKLGDAIAWPAARMVSHARTTD